MSETTYRLRLPYPTGGDPVDVPADVGALSTRLDAVAVGYEQGALASRPPSVSAGGRLYYATDDGTLYYDTGSGWIPAVWQPGDVRFTAAIATTQPGWLRLEGQEVSRQTYTALFNAIRDTYGASSGLTFRLPRAVGRTLIVTGTSTDPDLGTIPLGRIDGEVRHKLTTLEMPSHSHLRGYYDNAIPISGFGPTGVTRVVNATPDPVGTSSAGGDQPHNNMQPYLALNAWIKT